MWNVARLDGRSYLGRVERDPRTPYAVVDFEPVAGRVEHVGMRGRATLERYDAERAERLLASYLGPAVIESPGRFAGPSAGECGPVRFEPGTVLVREGSDDVDTGGGGP